MSLLLVISKWAIAEKIHTIPQMAFWKSEGMGGYLRLEFQRHGGWGGLDLEFSEGKDNSVFLENALILWT